MSDKKQETIADIVDEMRSVEFDDPSFDVYSLKAVHTLTRGWANRIEAAHKREREAGAEAAQICAEIGEMIGREAAGRQPVTDCNCLGNAAKMRESLEKARQVLHCAIIAGILKGDDAYDVLNVVTAALSTPPRNCDRPECATTRAAQEVWRKEDGCKTAYYEWLLATSTTGEAK